MRKPRLTTNQRAVLAYVNGSPGAIVPEIAHQTGLTESKVRRAMRSLYDRSLMIESANGAAESYHYPTDNGTRALGLCIIRIGRFGGEPVCVECGDECDCLVCSLDGR